MSPVRALIILFALLVTGHMLAGEQELIDACSPSAGLASSAGSGTLLSPDPATICQGAR
jgi:hypothetical protein